MVILNFILIAAFSLHGLAHLSGFFAAWTGRDLGYTRNPWIFSKSVTLRSTLGKVFGLLWLLAALTFLGSSLGLLFNLGWWAVLALVGALLSLVAIIPWWKTVPPGARAGAAFDVLILVFLLGPWNVQTLPG